MIADELLTRLFEACRGGQVPAPLAGEDMDTYRYRAALAGAVVATAYYLEDAQRQAEKGRPEDVTETSRAPYRTPPEPYRQDLAEVASRLRAGMPTQLASDAVRPHTRPASNGQLPLRETGGEAW